MFDMPDIHLANGQTGISGPDARLSVAAKTIPGTRRRAPTASADPRFAGLFGHTPEQAHVRADLCLVLGRVKATALGSQTIEQIAQRLLALAFPVFTQVTIG
jgi:hypothetical protein